MRNPGLNLVGLAASPGGGGLFRTRAEEELRQWLEQRLDALGIDPIAYSRYVLSFMRHPDTVIVPTTTATLDDPTISSFTNTNTNNKYRGNCINVIKDNNAIVVNANTTVPHHISAVAAAAAAAAVDTNCIANAINNTINAATCGRRVKTRPQSKLPLHHNQGDKEQRRAIVQCLISAADQKCGVETLVDELCARLKDLESGRTKDKLVVPLTALTNDDDEDDNDKKISLETPYDRALRYYAAFPALQSATNNITTNVNAIAPDKFSQWKERNFDHSNNIINNKYISSNDNNNIINNNNDNYFNNNNNEDNKINCNDSNCNKKKSNNIGEKENIGNKNRVEKINELFTPAETQLKIEKINQNEEQKVYINVGAMEQKREEQEMALDELRLAQLQAKFDESLEALWDTGPGLTRGTDSIWAAPSLSIMSGPSWPVESVVVGGNGGGGGGVDSSSSSSYPLAALERCTLVSPICRNFRQAEDTPLIPWDVDLFKIDDRSQNSSNVKSSSQTNLCWSDSFKDSSWCWGDLGDFTVANNNSSSSNNNINNTNNNVNDQSPRKTGFFPVIPCKSPIKAEKESSLHNMKNIPSLPEPDEDLLTSARTHFCPIKEDRNWIDGTTFPVNNALERVAYRRSDSGHLFYLPGGESPYMEYRETNTSNNIATNPNDNCTSVAPIVALTAAAIVSSNLTLKFRLRQCDKGTQTESISSPIVRKITNEQDYHQRLSYSLRSADDEDDDDNDEDDDDDDDDDDDNDDSDVNDDDDLNAMIDTEEIEKDSFNLDHTDWTIAQPLMLLRNERKRYTYFS